MLKFLREKIKDEVLGWSLQTNHSVFYFGTRHLTEDKLRENFSRFAFKKNKQVHSNIVIDAKDSPQSVDGLWTTEKNTALIAITADCVPILMSNGKKALALHAGWRGVASNIVGSAYESLTKTEQQSQWTVCVGPHIQKASFDIRQDSLKPLSEAWANVSTQNPPIEAINDEQWYFDLYALVLAQLNFYFRDNFNVYRLNFDTKQDPLFHSFRRDREQAGRNYSFVALKGP